MKSIKKYIIGLSSALFLCIGLTRLASQIDLTASRARAASVAAFTDPDPCNSPCNLSDAAAKNISRWS